MIECDSVLDCCCFLKLLFVLKDSDSLGSFYLNLILTIHLDFLILGQNTVVSRHFLQRFLLGALDSFFDFAQTWTIWCCCPGQLWLRFGCSIQQNLLWCSAWPPTLPMQRWLSYSVWILTSPPGKSNRLFACYSGWRDLQEQIFHQNIAECKDTARRRTTHPWWSKRSVDSPTVQCLGHWSLWSRVHTSEQPNPW